MGLLMPSQAALTQPSRKHTIVFELPDDIAQELQSKWKDLPRVALECHVLEAYKSRVLTAAQLRRLLDFATRMQVEAFLKKHEVYDFSAADFEQDRETLCQVRNPVEKRMRFRIWEDIPFTCICCARMNFQLISPPPFQSPGLKCIKIERKNYETNKANVVCCRIACHCC